MFVFTPGMLRVLTATLVACVPLGCWGPKSKGELGAENVRELAQRFKEVHKAKDVEMLRAIHVQQRFVNSGPWGERMIASTETNMPGLFELELVDVKVVEIPGKEEAVTFGYLMERTPIPENGHSSVMLFTPIHDIPYKILLHGRRPGEPNGPVMEIDAGLCVSMYQTRVYIHGNDPVLEKVNEWIRTGRLPDMYRSPDHILDLAKFGKLPNAVPPDWPRIVRPHS